MANYDWITNDPQIAEKLRVIDEAWAARRNRAAHKPMLTKLAEYKLADETRATELRRVLADCGIKVTTKAT